jgi:acyl-coenzyme A synthetase/AMP-(fatty) acid ligase
MVAGSRPIEVTRVRFYHHRGRTGDMLRVSGIWISPAEIEDVLAG